ncbi:MAG TPA: protein kinase [Terriglobales bacterium]|nr:protein kinase [Terriglobales bacterium]
MIGSTLGNYRLDEKIGVGGMGAVYRATDLRLGRSVAIKILTAVSADSQREALARFLREAKAQSRIPHPCIVSIHQVGTADEIRYIVMEFVEGKTLKKVIGGNPLPPSQICEYGIQIAEGLAVAHEAGIIHRDMKSQNVMITPRGQVKVLDFGLAKLKEAPGAPPAAAADLGRTQVYGEEPAAPPDPGEFKTQVGTIMGTATNMSPEQCLGTEVDARSDMFSFGVVLYEMATGRMPFEAPLAAALLMMILQKEPKPVREVVPGVPPELEQLIHQCLSKAREKRPTATGVAAALKKIQASLSVGTIAAPGTRSDSEAAYPPAQKMEKLPSTPAMPAVAPREQPGPAVAARPKTRRMPVLEEPPQTRRVYSALRVLRIAVSVGTVAVALAYFADFIIRADLIKTRALEGTFLPSFIRALVAPGLAIAEKMIHLQFGRWNVLLLALGVLTFVVRHFLLLFLEKIELRARTR